MKACRKSMLVPNRSYFSPLYEFPVVSVIAPVNTKIFFMKYDVLNKETGMLCDILAGKENSKVLYSKSFDKAELIISFRTLLIPNDLNCIYDWTHHPSAKEFWQMDVSIDCLTKTYSEILSSPYTHSFVGLLNNQPVCQVDVYKVLWDELKQHVVATEKDFGLHFLMSPVQKKIHNLSVCCMQTCIAFLFSFKDVERIFGEPDERNTKANQLVIKAGFQFLHSANLSYKKANVYCCTKQAFAQRHLYNLGFD